MTDATPAPSRSKDRSIETLRGLACVLIVAYHAIPAADAIEGLLNYGYLGHCFRLIRLPLFTAISGYVYAMHALAPDQFGRFMSGKARRILLPWVTVTLLTLVLRAALQRGSGLSLQDLLQSLWMPIDHLWFLPAIFWVFLATALLELGGCLATFRGWLLSCAVAWVGATLLLGWIPALGVTGFFQLLPFFLFGLGLCRFATPLRSPPALWVYTVTAVVGMTIHQLMWFGRVHLTSIEYNLLVLFTVYGTQGLLFRFRREVPALATLGAWSFAIYLFHPMAISIATRLAAAGHIDNLHAVFALKMALGLALPVALALVVRRIAPLNLVLLGERTRRTRAAVDAQPSVRST
jgi:peptidoglycan/LPS O-acetylase OafA/YrhL